MPRTGIICGNGLYGVKGGEALALVGEDEAGAGGLASVCDGREHVSVIVVALSPFSFYSRGLLHLLPLLYFASAVEKLTKDSTPIALALQAPGHP